MEAFILGLISGIKSFSDLYRSKYLKWTFSCILFKREEIKVVSFLTFLSFSKFWDWISSWREEIWDSNCASLRTTQKLLVFNCLSRVKIFNLLSSQQVFFSIWTTKLTRLLIKLNDYRDRILEKISERESLLEMLRILILMAIMCYIFWETNPEISFISFSNQVSIIIECFTISMFSEPSNTGLFKFVIYHQIVKKGWSYEYHIKMLYYWTTNFSCKKKFIILTRVYYVYFNISQKNSNSLFFLNITSRIRFLS